MCLNTIGGIAAEQARIYRATINDRIPAAEAARLVYILREVRSSIEAETAAIATAEATARATAMPTEIHIITVPTTFTIDDEKDPTRIRPQFFLEHESQPAPLVAPVAEPEPVAQSPKSEPVDNVFQSASLRRQSQPEPASETYIETLQRRAREADGMDGTWVMKDPGVKPRFPKGPSNW